VGAARVGLADALLASRSAIAGAVNTLESLHLIQRSRAAGERTDRVRIDMSSPHATGFDLAEYQEHGELAREGLRIKMAGRPATSSRWPTAARRPPCITPTSSIRLTGTRTPRWPPTSSGY